MTTATKRTSRDGGMTVLLSAAAAASLLGVAIAIVGGLAEGSSALNGALVGTVLAVGVFSFGVITVHVVASVLPTASLLVAVCTYTLQVVLMAVAFVALTGSGLLDESLDRRWLAGAVIGGTAVWLVAQVVLSTRRRIPIYDLPTEQTEGAASADRTGGER